MKNFMHSRRGAVLAAVLASLVVGVVAAGAAITWIVPPDTPTITTCVGKATGYIRVIDPAKQDCQSWETRLYLHNARFTHRVIVRWGAKVTVAPGGNAFASAMCAVDKGETAQSGAYDASRIPGVPVLQIDVSVPLDSSGGGIGPPGGGEARGWGFGVVNRGDVAQVIVPGVTCAVAD